MLDLFHFIFIMKATLLIVLLRCVFKIFDFILTTVYYLKPISNCLIIFQVLNISLW